LGERERAKKKKKRRRRRRLRTLMKYGHGVHPGAL